MEINQSVAQSNSFGAPEGTGLEVRSLSRAFGDRVAVDNVNFQVPAGMTIGFVGGNGAGKTTTMRMMMGLLMPSAGEVLWQGRPITTRDRRRIGYMPEERGLYAKQPLLSQLVYLGRLRGLSSNQAAGQATELLGALGLGDRLKDKLEKLSLGNQQRVQIAASLLGNPQAMVLDEPFSGLDPAGVDSMSDLLGSRIAEGVPLLFSSHQLDLVDRLCDGLVILHQGRVVAQGTREQLTSLGEVRHRLVTDTDTGWLRTSELAATGRIVVEDVAGPVATLGVNDPEAERQVLVEALNRGNVREFTPVRPSLGEIYRKVTAA